VTRWIGLVTLVASVIACDSTGPAGGPASGPGQLEAVLESPNGSEGAAMLQFVGPGITGVQAQGAEIYRTTSGDTTRVIVVVETAGKLSVFLQLTDLSMPPDWTILQVSGPDDALRPSLSGYRVAFVR